MCVCECGLLRTCLRSEHIFSGVHTLNGGFEGLNGWFKLGLNVYSTLRFGSRVKVRFKVRYLDTMVW